MLVGGSVTVAVGESSARTFSVPDQLLATNKLGIPPTLLPLTQALRAGGIWLRRPEPRGTGRDGNTGGLSAAVGYPAIPSKHSDDHSPNQGRIYGSIVAVAGFGILADASAQQRECFKNGENA
ncbi:hypothetical protein MW887_006021 [Aspergillus wentii]|nr:hypothetical protein MW887_006021 [Aspergillus wentii]